MRPTHSKTLSSLRSGNRLHVWLLPGLGLVACAGLVWVRGRNFLSVGTDWQIVLLIAFALATVAVASSPFRAHRSIGALLVYVAFISVIGLVAAPAAYTAAVGTAVSRVYTVSEKVQVRAAGCSRMVKFAEFRHRLDNQICVPDHIYRASSRETTLVVNGRESGLGVWLDTFAK